MSDRARLAFLLMLLSIFFGCGEAFGADILETSSTHGDETVTVAADNNLVVTMRGSGCGGPINDPYFETLSLVGCPGAAPPLR